MVTVGICLAVLAGVFSGSFGLPMKFTTKWRWENTWSLWSFWALVVVPWTFALIFIPNLFEIYSNASWLSLGQVFFFGFIWGFSAIAFGSGIDYLGLGFGYSLMMGLIISIGSLLPMITEYSENLFKASGLAIIAGVALIICGVALSAFSAVLKEKDLHSSESASTKEKKSFLKGIIICLVAGLTAPALNYCFIYGDQLKASAQALGASPAIASLAIWPVALGAGFITNILYCLLLVKKNNSWDRYVEKGTRLYYLYTFIMGLLWAGSSTIIYGISATYLGKLGPSIGWGLLMGISIIWANLLGVFAGEWKGINCKTKRISIAGLAALLLGVIIVGWANTL